MAADSSTNLHMTHADEDLYERGQKGAIFAIDQLYNALKVLKSSSSKKNVITVKWDGAPAIFVGTDPADGKFFIGTKGIFNKEPKVAKSEKEIKSLYPQQADKLIHAFKHIKKLGIPTNEVWQGDLMFTKGTLKWKTIEGKRFLVMHPNTLVYAVPKDSDLATTLLRADVGVIFHTTYKGRKTLDTYKASFGADVSKLKKSNKVWVDDAYLEDVAGKATFTFGETKAILRNLKKASALVSAGFDKIKNLMDDLPSAAAGVGIKTYINSLIRNNRYPNPKTAAKEYTSYVEDYWKEKVISKVKTDSAKTSKTTAMKQFIFDLNKIEADISNSFEFIELINNIKLQLIGKFNELQSMKIFVEKSNGDFIVSNPEGYVAIGTGAAVKLVDRLNFSKHNFDVNIVKGWQKAT